MVFLILIYTKDIRKILRGDFKGRKHTKEINLDIVDNHNTEAARLARMEGYMLSLKDDGYDENDEDVVVNTNGISIIVCVGNFNKEELR